MMNTSPAVTPAHAALYMIQPGTPVLTDIIGAIRNTREKVNSSALETSSGLCRSESAARPEHRAARIAQTGTNIKKVARQPNASATTAPSGAPAAVPAPLATAHHPNARARPPD